MPEVDSTVPTPEIGAKEKIQILLAEYNTLRAEVLQRNTVLNQFLIVSVTTTLAIVGSTAVNRQFAVSLFSFLILLMLISMVFWIVMRDTRKISSRIRELETSINDRAGERLLRWETDHGVVKNGYWSGLSS